jgi:hypothetical protein
MARTLFRNYTKRNSVAPYLQSHGAIGSLLIKTVFEAVYLEDGKHNTNANNKVFWLYTALREDILPINYFNQVIEPDVLSKTFNYIFELIDPEMFEILGNIPSLVFIRHFINLFTEFENEDISLVIIDLLFAFGSGYTTSTVTDPEIRVDDDILLCRTSQLLICIALVMTRQVLYDFNLRKETPE